LTTITGNTNGPTLQEVCTKVLIYDDIQAAFLSAQQLMRVYVINVINVIVMIKLTVGRAEI